MKALFRAQDNLHQSTNFEVSAEIQCFEFLLWYASFAREMNSAHAQTRLVHV